MGMLLGDGCLGGEGGKGGVLQMLGDGQREEWLTETHTHSLKN